MKTLLRVITFLLAILGIVFAMLLAMKYFEQPKSKFSNYEEMERAGLIAHRWLPAYLPRSATQIEESHDIDTNSVRATFSYRVGDVETVESICRIVAETEEWKKYLCPPFEKRTSTLILSSNGQGYYLSYENGI